MSNEIAVCPNCGSLKIVEKWVYKSPQKREPTKISMIEKIAKIELPPSIFQGNILCGDSYTISNPTKPTQLVMFCQDCGFTVVRPIG